MAYRIAVRAKLSLWATGILLEEMHDMFPQLPLDARTLLYTPRHCKRTYIGGGQYVHFGLRECISRVLDEHNGWYRQVSLQLHIDGVTLFKSSRTQLWPILGRLLFPKSKVFVVGIFCGQSKPKNVTLYLEQLVDELNILLKDGIVHNEGSNKTSLVLESIIADAPARAFIRQVKMHSGYYSCERCTTSGDYLNGKVVFPPQKFRLRSDVDFRSRRQGQHHIGDSPFERLPIDMISAFPLDYMHMVCLGVMKRFITLWRSGPIDNGVRIGASSFRELNDRILRIRPHLTMEFPRKCRTLVDFDRWKATELRQFFLYIGPVSLEGILPEMLYKNFLSFSICIYLLCSPKFYSHYLTWVASTMEKTVSQFAGLYGLSEVTFNMHGLLHLPQDVSLHGPLDSFSAFIFESFMQTLRGFVRSPNLPVAQIFRRISERMHAADIISPSPFHFEDCLFTKLPKNSFRHSDCIVTCRKPDNAVLIHGRPAVVVAIDNERVCVQRFSFCESFFDFCLPSSDVGIFRCSNLLSTVTWFSKADTQCKGLLLPSHDMYIFYPLLHSWL